MIVKERDANRRTIAALERRASVASDEIVRSGCRSAVARLKVDPTTERACAFVEEWFGDAEDWAVIHDLRLRIDGHAIQLNHVLISDTLDVVCLDTRHIDHGLVLAERGPCRAVGPDGTRLIASPLDALARNVRKLSTELRRVGPPRVRLGLGPRMVMHGRVLVDPTYRSSVAPSRLQERIGVHPRDALHTMFWKRRRRSLGVPFEQRVPPERLEAFAVRLAERHLLSFSPHLLVDDARHVDACTERLIRIG